jgi:hypothetical protein
VADRDFLDSLTDTSLYSIGAYFCDAHPELVDDVIAQGEGIERHGLVAWAKREDTSVEQAYQTLMTALAVRYYNAVAGSS